MKTAAATVEVPPPASSSRTTDPDTRFCPSLHERDYDPSARRAAARIRADQALPALPPRPLPPTPRLRSRPSVLFLLNIFNGSSADGEMPQTSTPYAASRGETVKEPLVSTRSARNGTLASVPALESNAMVAGADSRSSQGRRRLTMTLGSLFTKTKKGESGMAGNEDAVVLGVGAGDCPDEIHLSPLLVPIPSATFSLGLSSPASLNPPSLTHSPTSPNTPSLSPPGSPPLSPPRLSRENRSSSIGRLTSWASRSSLFIRSNSSQKSPVLASSATLASARTSPTFSQLEMVDNEAGSSAASGGESSRRQSASRETASTGPAVVTASNGSPSGTHSRGTSGGRSERRGSQSSGESRERRIPGDQMVDDGVMTDSEGEEDDDDQVELSDFIRASGTTTPAPTAPAAQVFSTANAMRSTPTDPPGSPASTIIPTPKPHSTRQFEATLPMSPSRSSSPPLQERRSRNISGLSLGQLSPPISGPSSPVTTSPRALASPGRLPSIPQASSSTAPTAQRMNTLPRLLSSHAYTIPPPRANGSNAGASVTDSEDPGTETDTDLETETDTEAEDESDGGGDDTFASADEGFSRPATPSAASLRSPVPLVRLTSFENAPPQATRNKNRPSTATTPLPSLSAWTTFAPTTPTPGGELRTARPTADQFTAQSYFDLLPRPGGSRTPGPGSMLSPLIPMSIASSARGKRPTREGDTSPIVASPSSGDGGAGLYRHRSHSAQNLLSPGLGGSDEEDREEDLLGLHPIWQSGVGPITPGPSFLSPPLPSASSPDQPPKDLERKASVVTSTPRLHRPRSMYELHIAPPAYHAVYNRPGLGTAQIVYPREEEGIEGLPDYTCSVHIETYMPRKVEFTAPSTQAKDRAWKKQYVVLHGTSIKVFKYDLRTHPIVGEEDWSGGAGMGAGADGNAPVHFHMGEYGVPESAQGSSSLFPTSMGIVKAKARSRLPSGSSGLNVLLRHYSLQNAESGLAADYVKRKHVVRVRAEGEQFLLQAKDDRGVIDLIEALQAATNVSLDLDARPLPKFITLPRRRRRRRRPTTGAAEAEVIAAVVEESRLRAMLEDEQRAYAQTTAGASEV